MAVVATTIRLEPSELQDLKLNAARESVRRRESISASDIVRELVRGFNSTMATNHDNEKE